MVDNIKEEKMHEAKRLRQYQQASGDTVSLDNQPASEQRMPAHFNPYYKQQQEENAAVGHR